LAAISWRRGEEEDNKRGGVEEKGGCVRGREGD